LALLGVLLLSIEPGTKLERHQVYSDSRDPVGFSVVAGNNFCAGSDPIAFSGISVKQNWWLANACLV
jgi:hypothetical protein